MAKKKKRQNKSKHNGLKNTIAVLCLIVGLILIFLGPIKEFIVSWLGNDYAVTNVDANKIKENMGKDANFDFGNVTELDMETVLRARLMKDGMHIVGGIAIPSVSLNLPVIKGVDKYSLAVGAGTMKETQVMGEGNYALASHRMQNRRLLFTPLFDLKGGELIYLTDLTDVYVYEVTSLTKVEVDRVDVIEDVPGEKMVTLVTCDYDTDDLRLIVQGKLKEKFSVKDAPKEAVKAFDLETNEK